MTAELGNTLAAVDLAATLDTLCDALRAGETRRAAARLACIHFSTLYDWMAAYPDVSDAIVRAEMEARAGVERQMHSQALDPATPLRDKLRYAQQAPSMKHDWSDLQAQALARALTDDQIRELLGATDTQPRPLAQDLPPLPPGQETIEDPTP